MPSAGDQNRVSTSGWGISFRAQSSGELGRALEGWWAGNGNRALERGEEGEEGEGRRGRRGGGGERGGGRGGGGRGGGKGEEGRGRRGGGLRNLPLIQCFWGCDLLTVHWPLTHPHSHLTPPIPRPQRVFQSNPPALPLVQVQSCLRTDSKAAGPALLLPSLPPPLTLDSNSRRSPSTGAQPPCLCSWAALRASSP